MSLTKVHPKSHPRTGLKAHFAEVSFSVAGCLQMAEAGVWNMLSYFIHNTHVL